MLTTLFATSYCPDGGSGYHMAVAHSYCYELLLQIIAKLVHDIVHVKK